MDTVHVMQSPAHKLLDRFQSGPNDYLLKRFEILTEEQQNRLIADLSTIDFDRLAELFSNKETADTGARLARQAKPPAKMIPQDVRTEFPEDFRNAEEAGWNALSEGRVGIILVAGGEGTRLGFPHPKGKYPISPVNHKSLYQLLAEQAVAISKRAGRPIPYYVMTSNATHDETVEFFTDHNYFGLEPEKVRFFRQGNMPAVDQETGRILLAAPDQIALSPDGHGGLLDAMQSARIFDDVRERQIEVLFYHQVDNPLARVCDPAFLGFHLLNNAQVSTKVVAKEAPAEKVGLLVEVDGRHHIIEYTDLSQELASQTDQSGRLRLRCGNIAIHLFQCDFLERMARDVSKMSYHRSSKSVPFIDDRGELQHPAVNNAFKFEKFIFDILPHAERPLAMEVVRENEFVPLKNREGQFSADHVRESMRRQHTSWLKQAGWTDSDELPIEIPASVALNAADFVQQLTK